MKRVGKYRVICTGGKRAGYGNIKLFVGVVNGPGRQAAQPDTCLVWLRSTNTWHGSTEPYQALALALHDPG